MKVIFNTLRRGMVVLGVLLCASAARADRRDLLWSYGWHTPAAGEWELETHYQHEPSTNQHHVELELEHGVTDRWAMSGYLLAEGERGKRFGYGGFRLENRYRFGSYARRRLLHAAYLELEKEDDEKFALEAKWLMALYTKQQDTFAVNWIVEQPLSARGVTTFGYTAGWSRQVASWRLGVESVGNFRDGTYGVGPTVLKDFTQVDRVGVNALFRVVHRGEGLVLNAVYEHEF